MELSKEETNAQIEKIRAFPVFKMPDQPLKIGLHRDLIALGFHPKIVKFCLGRWCWPLSYRKSVVQGAIRIDLYGKPAGVVTAEEASHARDAVQKIRALNRARTQAENVIRGQNAKARPEPMSMRVCDAVKASKAASVAVSKTKPPVPGLAVGKLNRPTLTLRKTV